MPFVNKVHFNDGLNGGDELVVESGGVLNIKTGGIIKANGTQAAAIPALTDSTTGTANDTLVDVGSSFTQATLNNNFADLAAKINALILACKNAGITA